MKQTFPITILALLIADPSAAQQAGPDCSEIGSFASCPTNTENDRWEQIFDALHELTEEPVCRSGADPQKRIGAIAAEIQRLERERLLHEIRQTAQPAARYENALDLLQASGIAWAEACALAGADAYGVDWLTASRRCVKERTGADSYSEFLEALIGGHVSAQDACIAGEHYWNGLSEAKARMACAIRREKRNR